MKRSSNRILTTHTGSLARPDDLAELMIKRLDGEPVDQRALDERIRLEVRNVVRKQAEIGIDVVDDGEFGKPGFNNYVTERLAGFGGADSPWRPADLADFPDWPGQVRQRRRPTAACNAPISVRNLDLVRTDVANLKAALEGVQVEEAFIPAASPGAVALITANEYYPSQEAYLFAIAEAMKYEYKTIVDAGFIVQFDAPDLGMCGHIHYADLSRQDFRQAIELHVEALNHAIAGLPADRMRIHLCWGNYQGPHHRDRPLGDVIDIALKAKVQGVSFEASNPRHEHEWRVWQDLKLPEGKILIPGVIDSHTNYIEHPQLVADRIVRIARLVGRENVIAGTDCGFGTFVEARQVVPSVGWAKLGSMVEGAKLASTELWGWERSAIYAIA